MDYSVSELSTSISKEARSEEMSFSRAAYEDSLKRTAVSISNEDIKNRDRILDTYEVMSDPILGGMGSVWRVYHRSWDVDLAMKRPQPRFFAEAGEQRKAEFIAECENWIDLGLHPNIVSCYYVRDIGGVPTIFSEWMDAGSLKDRIRDGSLYDGEQDEVQKRILDIAIQAARGLQYSHEKGLVHQDMKPGNLLLNAEWEAKVADFGLAKAQSQLTEAAVSSGYTPAYCPKEQAEGAAAEPWMDIYSWALTVLEMYAGERIWNSGTEAGIHYEELFEKCRIPIPEGMKTILEDCILQDEREHMTDFNETEQALLDLYLAETGERYPRARAGSAQSSAGSFNNRALSFLDLGITQESEKAWEEAIALDAANEDALCNRFIYQWRQGRMDDLELSFLMRSHLHNEEEAEQFDRQMEREKEAFSLVREWTGRDNRYFNNTAVSPDGSMIACDMSGYVCVFPFGEGDPYFERSMNDVQEIRFSPDSRTVYVMASGDLIALDAEKGNVKSHIACPSYTKDSVYLFISPDGERIAVFYYMEESRMPYLLLVDTNAAGSGELVPVRGYGLPLRFLGDACMMPDGKSILMLKRDEKDCLLISMETGKTLKEYSFVLPKEKAQKSTADQDSEEDDDIYDEEEKDVTFDGIAISPDGRILAAVTNRGEIRAHSMEDGSLIFEQPVLGTSKPEALLFLPSGRTLITGDKDGIVRAISLFGGTPVLSWDKSEWVRELQVLDDGSFAVISEIISAKNAKVPILKYEPKEVSIPMRISRISSYQDITESFDKFHELMKEAEEAIDSEDISGALDLLDKAEACDYRDNRLLQERYMKLLPRCDLAGIKNVRRVGSLRADRETNRVPGIILSVFYSKPGNMFLSDTEIKIDLSGEEPRFERGLYSWHNGRLSVEGDKASYTKLDKILVRDLGTSADVYVGYARPYSVKDLHCSDDDVLAVIEEKRDREISKLVHFRRTRRDAYESKVILEGPAFGGIKNVCVSSDSHYYVSVGDEIIQYGLRDDKPGLSFSAEPELQHFGVSKDGRILAYGHRTKWEVQIHTDLVFADTVSGKELSRIPVDQHIREVYWTERDLLLLSLENGEVWLIDHTAAEPVLYKFPTGTGDVSTDSAALSEDFRYLAVADSSCTVYLWEIAWKYTVRKKEIQKAPETVKKEEPPVKKGFFARLFGR